MGVDVELAWFILPGGCAFHNSICLSANICTHMYTSWKWLTVYKCLGLDLNWRRSSYPRMPGVTFCAQALCFFEVKQVVKLPASESCACAIRQFCVVLACPESPPFSRWSIGHCSAIGRQSSMLQCVFSMWECVCRGAWLVWHFVDFDAMLS